VGSSTQEAFWNLIQSVNLTATANAAGATSDNLCNTDAFTLAVYQYLYSKGLVSSNAQQVLGTSNGAYPVTGGVKINFLDPWSNVPTLTRLDARLLANLQLSIGFRDQTAIVAGGVAGTATLTNAQVVLTVREWQNVPEVIRPYLKISNRQAPIVNQTNALDVQGIPTGNLLRRELLQGIVPAVAGYNYGWSSPAAFGATGQAQGPMWGIKTNNSVQLVNTPLNANVLDLLQLLGVAASGAPQTAGGITYGWYGYEPARNKAFSASIPMWGVQKADDYIDVAAPGTYGSYYRFTDFEIVGATPALVQNNGKMG
jgi:hypothetical protein